MLRGREYHSECSSSSSSSSSAWTSWRQLPQTSRRFSVNAAGSNPDLVEDVTVHSAASVSLGQHQCCSTALGLDPAPSVGCPPPENDWIIIRAIKKAHVYFSVYKTGWYLCSIVCTAMWNVCQYFGNDLGTTLHVTSALLKVVEMRSQTSLVVYFWRYFYIFQFYSGIS